MADGAPRALALARTRALALAGWTPEAQVQPEASNQRTGTPLCQTRTLALTLSLTLALTLVGCTCTAKTTPPPITRAAGQVAQAVIGNEHNKRSAIGINLSSVVDWSTEHAFVDVFKTSRQWFSSAEGKWGDDRPLDIDEHGWVRSLKPGQWARTLALWEIDHYPAGKYVVLYDGKGELYYDRGPASNRFVEEESKPGRHIVDIDPARGNQGLALIIKKTDPSDPIRNIRVIMPGGVCSDDALRYCDDSTPCEGTATCQSFEQHHERVLFNPRFLKRITKFSVVRFMDWMATNDSQQSKWGDRPKVTDAQWSIKGVPLEIMIALAHRLQAEPWFTLPHLADDDYVNRFAATVRDKLDPKSRVWVEFSNEIWNDQFEQSRHVAKACAAGRREDSNYNGSHLCYAERAIQVFHVWNTVFGDQSKRVVRVLGSHAASAWASERILSHLDAHKHADALAIAPYFGSTATPENETELLAMDTAALINKTRQVHLKETIGFINEQAALSKKFGIDLVAYEGGPAYDAVFGSENNDRINALFDAVSRDPKLAPLYVELLNAWKKSGAKTFVHFSSCGRYTKWGRWGLLEYITQPRDTAPKYDALLRFIDDNPRWW